MIHFFILSAIFFFFVLPVIIWCIRMLCALSLYFHPDVMERRERENEIIRKAKESDKEARKAARAKTKWVWQQDPNNPGRNIHVEVPNVPEDISNWPKAPLWLPRNESGMTAEEVSDFNEIERNRGGRNFIKFEPSPKYPTGERGADDWKKKWKAGAYDHIDPSYVPGSHEIERGEVTWHDVTKCEKQDPINDVRGRRRPPITKTQAILILVGAIVAACFFIAICVGSVH